MNLKTKTRLVDTRDPPRGNNKRLQSSIYEGGNMKFTLMPRSTRKSRFSWLLALAVAALPAAFFCVSSQAQVVQSGQRVHGQNEIEPGFDDSTGNVIYLKTPLNTPIPTHTNHPSARNPNLYFARTKLF